MAATTINVELKDAGNQPLQGYVSVQLDYPLTNNTGQTFEPYSRIFTLDASGKTSFALEPSDVAKVTYYFESHAVYAGVDTRLDYFHAVVPSSILPVPWTALAQQVGGTKDNQDASITAVIRRMMASPDFWAGVGQNTFRVKGEYNNSAYYSIGDIVMYNGNGYMSVSPSNQTGIAPDPNVSTANWKIIVQKGTTGSGTTGDPTPYSTATWTDNIAPARVAVKNIIQTLATQSALTSAFTDSVLAGSPTATGSLGNTDNSNRVATTQWVQQLITSALNAVIPIGTVVSFAGTSAPTGWMLLDGRVLTRATYPGLFAICSTNYNTGGETALQFRIPDLRGRVAVSPDSTTVQGSAGRLTALNTLAAVGGLSAVTLSIAQMPSHNHVVSQNKVQDTSTLGATANGYDVPVSGVGGGASRTFTMNNVSMTGSGSSHENMPPYQVLNAIIYIGQ